MQSCSVLTVDLAAIEHNLKKLCEACGHVMVMVKANAYGTDPLVLAQFLQTLNWPTIPYIGVSHVWEGVRLREAGIVYPIFVLSAPPYEAEVVARHQLTAAVSTCEEAYALNETGKKQDVMISVHMHLDTGMSRSGVSATGAHALYEAIQKCSHLYLEGAMTHFAAAEMASFDMFTREQIVQFETFLKTLPTPLHWIHAANSSGAVRFPLPSCNLARIGLGLMGLGICLEGIKPALTLTTTLAAINAIEQGVSVGYNRSHVFTKEKGQIGVIPFGYYDGFPRSLSGKGYVLICGKKAPMIGTVCMDFMMIDLSVIPEAKVGDEVVLFGEGIPPELIATWAGTDIREILVHLPPRVKRLWKSNLRNIEGFYAITDSKKLPSPLHAVEKNTASR